MRRPPPRLLWSAEDICTRHPPMNPPSDLDGARRKDSRLRLLRALIRRGLREEDVAAAIALVLLMDDEPVTKGRSA